MVNGIINIYKEKGYTSHDVVAKLRGIVGQKKIGHTGTLDPDAEGVLPVCLGRATKLCDMLTDKNKTYEAVLLFGKMTDTQDITGKILELHEIHCHHKKPVSQGGDDRYENLIILHKDIHRLLHATKEETIKAYLSQLQLTYKQNAKLNKLRQLANMQAI